MTRNKMLIVIAAVSATAGLSGSAILKSRRQTEFRMASVQRGDIDATISATGTSNAVVSVQVGARYRAISRRFTRTSIRKSPRGNSSR